jgi:membrane protein implicated in regulation of membrane protease activity
MQRPRRRQRVGPVEFVILFVTMAAIICGLSLLAAKYDWIYKVAFYAMLAAIVWLLLERIRSTTPH